MARSRKFLVFGLGGAVALLALFAAAALVFVDVGRYKPRLESAASRALGLDVRIGGRLGLGLFPGLHVTVDDGRVLGPGGEVIASAKQARFWIALLPLLRREVRLNRVELADPVLTLEREADGSFDVDPLRKSLAALGALDGGSLALAGGTLRYTDRASGDTSVVTGLEVQVRRLRFPRVANTRPWSHVGFEAELRCAEIRTRDLAVTALELSAHATDGALRFDPVTMRIFGGRLAGDLRVDLSGPVATCQVRCSLRRFQIEEFLKVLSPKQAVEGRMDFSASLAMRGTSVNQMIESAAGELSLRGRDLTIVGNDLDRTLSRFASSQGFNLVDVGAVFFAGPLGLAVTKGYGFASLFRGSGGTSRIATLVSDWRVERGVAQARDVAMATSENRIALRGGLDFVHARFADVTVAAVDAKGCTKVRQVIRGSFADPVVERPRILMSLAGPMVNLYGRTRRLFPAGPCEVFYSGSVAPPK